MCKHTFVDQSMYKHTFVVINDIEQVFCLWIWPQRNRNYIWKPKKFKPRLNWNVEKEIYETGRVISYWLYYINNKEWTHKSEREKENSDTICVYVHGALRYTCSLAPSRPNKAFREKGQKKKMNGELLYIVKGTCYSLASNLTRKLQLVVIWLVHLAKTGLRRHLPSLHPCDGCGCCSTPNCSKFDQALAC
jgi:hypothetical protein